MKLSNIALALLAAVGAGCAGVQSAPPAAQAELPNCFDAAYDRGRDLFTIRNEAGNPVNQQCLLTVGPRGGVSSPQQIAAGDYRTYLSNGGGGGGGGSIQAFRVAGSSGGGGGGGGAGAAEMRSTVKLTEGVYKLTIGAGGPGGTACKPSAGFSGGPGWLGSPSNMIRVATGEVVIGVPGADAYSRSSRSENERTAGPRDGHGGSGPGQASGGHGATGTSGAIAHIDASSGASRGMMPGGTTGTISVADKTASGSGGGGGASVAAAGGDAGGESPRQPENLPERGSLGSGGGGGEGSTTECDPGARGGHGYIAFRRI